MDTRKILRILHIILLTAVIAPSLQAKTAREVVRDVEAKLRQAPSVTASFSFSGSDISGNGTIILSGSKFRMSVGNVRYWYNGKTLWTYFINNKEVYISEPTADELAEINPASVLNAVTKDCTFTMLKSASGTYKVKCSAKSQSVPFSTMTVTVSTATGLPSHIAVTSRRNGDVSLTLTDAATGKSVSASTFTFNTKDAPGAEVIDMR